MTDSTVVSIHIATKAEAPMLALQQVYAELGRGLEGDRYAEHLGTYSDTPGSGREVTLIESEQLALVEREFAVKLGPGESRRNITTRGVDLNALVEREFRVGEVVLRGTRLCEPCDYVAKLTGNADNLVKALVHRGGLRCDIVRGGTIHVGDEISVV